MAATLDEASAVEAAAVEAAAGEAATVEVCAGGGDGAEGGGGGGGDSCGGISGSHGKTGFQNPFSDFFSQEKRTVPPLREVQGIGGEFLQDCLKTREQV